MSISVGHGFTCQFAMSVLQRLQLTGEERVVASGSRGGGVLPVVVQFVAAMLQTVSEIWGLLGLHLADDPVLPFDYLSYASQLQNHTTALRALLDNEKFLQPLIASVDEFTAAAIKSQKEAKKLEKHGSAEDFTELRQRTFNDRLILAERGFLEAEGLRGRPWFKHLLYSPPEDYESRLNFFPGIVDAISQTLKMSRREALLQIQHEIWKVARAIQRAAAALRGELT